MKILIFRYEPHQKRKQTMENKHKVYITLDYLYDEGSKINEYTKDQLLAINKVIDVLEDKYIK